ncbi:MAG: hypothetical protein KF764_07875 [Labilithrix sp.]|nr:hypothetical protein [Labilithrix sp.]
MTCRDGIRSELDCTTKDCELSFSCDAQPKAAACLVVSGGAECGFESCSTESFREACDGDTHVFCQNGVVKHVDCSPKPGRVVTACGERPGGGIGCVSATPACAPEARPHCEGAAVVSCIAGRETRRSCEAYPIPMVCGVEAPCGPDASCVTCIPSPRLRCDPQKHVDRCKGTSVVYCDGQEREVDCVALGFRECTTANGPATCR